MSGGNISNIPYFLSDDILDEVKTHFEEVRNEEHQEEVWRYTHKISDDLDDLAKVIKSLDDYISGDTSVEDFLKEAKTRYKEINL